MTSSWLPRRTRRVGTGPTWADRVSIANGASMSIINYCKPIAKTPLNWARGAAIDLSMKSSPEGVR
jgi:hypothetical protein